MHTKQVVTHICLTRRYSAVKLWDCRAGRGPIPLEVSDYSPLGDRPRGITDLKLDHDGRRLFCLRMDNT